MLDFSISTTHSSSKLVFIVFVTYLFYSNLQTTQTSLFFLTLSIIYLNIFLATAIEFLDVFVGLLSDSRDWWTKGSPLIHTYCFSSATDRSQDVLERVSVVLGCDSIDLIDVSIVCFFDFSSFEKNFYINHCCVHLY